jgi:hypothetical protein
MKARFLVALAVLGSALACTRPPSTPTPAPSSPSPSAAAAPAPPAAPPAPAEAPVAANPTKFGFGTAIALKREGEVAVANVFVDGLDEVPTAGSEVSIIPLEVPLPPLTLPIVSAKRMEGCLPERISTDVEVPLVTDPAWVSTKPLPNRSDQFPFDMFVLYPAVPEARALPTAGLGASELPEAITPTIIKAAIDLDGDQDVDVIDTRYCCREPAQPPGGQCDYTCGKTFRKEGQDWKLIAFYEPC